MHFTLKNIFVNILATFSSTSSTLNSSNKKLRKERRLSLVIVSFQSIIKSPGAQGNFEDYKARLHYCWKLKIIKYLNRG